MIIFLTDLPSYRQYIAFEQPAHHNVFNYRYHNDKKAITFAPL